jgi:hypothetical protein
VSYASTSGRARTSSRNPRSFAVCDRCGIWYNRDELKNQVDWRGAQLLPLFIFVCPHCYDEPQEQLRAITLPPDPVPIYLPRPEDFVSAETDYRSTATVTIDPVTGIPIPSQTLLVTPDCQNRVTQEIGAPVGLDQNAVMPYNGGVQHAYGTPLAVLSVSSNGTATVTVTCSAVHGLVTNNQISVEGLSNNAADGFFSVNVLTATAFTYMTANNIAAGSLLTPTTLMITALIGLPYGATTIPQVGT